MRSAEFIIIIIIIINYYYYFYENYISLFSFIKVVFYWDQPFPLVGLVELLFVLVGKKPFLVC